MSELAVITKSKDLCNKEHLSNYLKLEFNEKTQIFPLSQGVDYLGFHFYITETGKVIRRLRTQRKIRMKRKFKNVKEKYKKYELDLDYISQMVNSYRAHLSYGHTHKLWEHILDDFVLNHTDYKN